MNRYINSADALHTLKHLAYETALNQHDPYVADVFEDIAKNRLETWVDLIPTADVVGKEWYDILLEHANILAEEMRKYQNADVQKVKPEPLTDKEQRIFLAAMSREEKVCKEVDAETTREPYEESLVRVCREIERKVKKALWTN